jgi:hypothetical protein
MARVRTPIKFVKGSQPGANGILGAVKPVGARPRAVNTFPGIRTKNPPPPGNPTGKGYVTG